MKKTIKTEDLLTAIENIKEVAREERASSGFERDEQHGYGMEDAMIMLENALKIGR